jgi:hypothetical protein
MRSTILRTLLLSTMCVMLMAFSCQESLRMPSEDTVAESTWQSDPVDTDGESVSYTLTFTKEQHFTLGFEGAYFDGEYFQQGPAVILRFSGVEEMPTRLGAVPERQPRAVLTLTPDGTLIGHPFTDRPKKLRSYKFHRIVEPKE